MSVADKGCGSCYAWNLKIFWSIKSFEINLIFRKRSKYVFFCLYSITRFYFFPIHVLITSENSNKSWRIHGIWDFFFSQSISFFNSLIAFFKLLGGCRKSSSSFEQIVCYSIHLNSQNFIFTSLMLQFSFSSVVARLYKLPGMYRNYWLMDVRCCKLVDLGVY